MAGRGPQQQQGGEEEQAPSSNHASQHAPDEDSDEEEEDDAASSCSGSSSSQMTDGSAASDAPSKKKKKKKKKSKKKGKGGAAAGAEGGAGPPAPAPAPVSKQDRAAAEKRFAAALATLKANDDLWVNLGGSLIQDAKVEQLLAKLKSNTAVTSLDLSGNLISDSGAEAISAMLEEQGSASELIEMDLRDNSNISPAGQERLAQLAKRRGQLHIRLGSVMDEAVPAEGKEMAALSKGNRLVRQHFQSQDEAEDAGPQGQQHQQGMDEASVPNVSPAELWSRITMLLEGGRASISELALALQELAAVLQYEQSVTPPPDEGQPDELLQPGSHAHACLSNLSLLQAAMQLEPATVLTQGSKGPQPAVGSHRVWASAVIALLLTRGSHAIDQALSGFELVPALLQLTLQRPRCNTLHTKALHVLHACANSEEDSLLASSLSGAQLGVPFLDAIVDIGSKSAGVSCGMRSPLVGFVISAARILQGMCNDPPGPIKCGAVQRALEQSNRWQAFVSPGGALEELCEEQDQELGGPRPAPMAFSDPEGGMMSGADILSLFQSMNLGGSSLASAANADV